MKKVVVIDYGMSNLRSVSKALEHVANNAWQVQISRQIDEILQADKVVFPGQGAIGNCMQLLRETQLHDVIRQVIAEKPFLGICLGLQTLLTASEESGGTQGFNVIDGMVKHFPTPLLNNTTQEKLKIPQIGWNQVKQTQAHPLWQGIEDNSRFYFVHSYYVDVQNTAHIAGQTQYGINYTSVIGKNNVFAVQFHPEKSQYAGLKLLENFLNWDV